MISARVSAICILGLLVLRAIMAAELPLSADEAYYWLWSRYPDLGYFDHPPMIAWLIRAGTFLFGNTPFGVRLAGIVLSLPATVFVWRAASLILKNEERAGHAALFFNLSLMVSVEMLAATPDMPSLVTSAAFVYFLARIEAEGDGRFWLGAGIAAGLGLLSKFSALFLGLGVLLWLILDHKARRWLLSPWPYLGAVLALLIFVPNLVWQSQHHWESFVFQLARTGAGHFTLRYLGEFLAAQFGLATPLIFVLMAAGLWRATKLAKSGDGEGRLMLAMLVWVGLGYFFAHALHDRVQGNWPCFLYPALSILAADGFGPADKFRRLPGLAAALAMALVLAVYLQAQYGLVPLKRDPLARILGREFAPIGEVVAALVKTHLAEAVLTTDYETTAWLRFNQPDIQVVQVTEPQRYPQAPPADMRLLQRPLIYLTELRRDQHQLVQKLFAYTGFPTQLQTPSSLYMVYPVGRPKSSFTGKMP
ncbi:MAG TPA: glycosyltransferase family 39 protein [Rhizomicrobium sp.]|nr:glycosyltransferase family 39 protein [Rhizomicrobium sp.]